MFNERSPSGGRQKGVCMMENGLSRRQLIRLLSAGAAVTSVGALTGCSVGDFGDQKPAAKGSVKTLRFGMSGATTSADIADPALSNTQHDGRLMTAVYEQLTRYDESLQAVPWLAESWSANRLATEWQFKLRRGVTFHDGHTLTAEDVVHSFGRVLDPKTASPGAALLGFLDPGGLRAVDDYTVSFKLKEPIGDLPLALITKQSFIVPAGATSEDLRRNAVGTGAFRLEEFTPGEERTLFVANDKYWGDAARLSALELVSIPETATRMAALQRGQVEIVENVPATDIPRAESKGLNILKQSKGDMEMFAMQTDVAPFDDVRVRQALKYALDRRGMIDLVAQGQGTELNDVPVSSDLQYGLGDPVRQRNVEKAKELLAQAGHRDGLSIELATSDVQARFMDFATVYKGMAADAGIDLKLAVSPADSYWDEVWLQQPAFVTAWIARPAESMLAMLFMSDSSSNETHWDRPEWERRFRQGRASQSTSEREAIFRELQTEVVEEGGYLAPYMANTISATSPQVTGWMPSGTFFENFNSVSLDG
jgi:peptide/nickel transport system substrate-binding protein